MIWLLWEMRSTSEILMSLFTNFYSSSLILMMIVTLSLYLKRSTLASMDVYIRSIQRLQGFMHQVISVESRACSKNIFNLHQIGGGKAPDEIVSS